MKLALPLRLAALATAVLASITPFSPAKANTFDEQLVEQNQFIAVAVPLGSNSYNLLVIEQIPGKRECWSESGSNPVTVDPLLLNFDFTGICRRSTDSNGYSIRIDGQDLGLDYMLRIVERNGELMLVGTHRRDPYMPDMLIGRTYGLNNGFAKIFLNSGWRFTKRSYQGKTLGHVYFSGSQLTIGTPGDSIPEDSIPEDSIPGGYIPESFTPESSIPGGSTPGSFTSTFGDITTDIYKSEIEQAVGLRFIAGFKEDNTFRPQAALTREQLVSMVIEALSTIPNTNIRVLTQASSQPYPDVLTSRWSAAKIQWAQQNQIVSGYPDGTFQPTKPVTRAELMAVLRRGAEYAKVQLGLSPELTSKQTGKIFSDTSDHWAESLVSQMSSYCEVASPLNETGNAFSPDTPSRRNYAAAATLRMLNCVKA
ncbi:MAG: DUF3747 domain-containing protein [Xenococcaceae cyanobacterium]